jgi:hypothetical protein
MNYELHCNELALKDHYYCFIIFERTFIDQDTRSICKNRLSACIFILKNSSLADMGAPLLIRFVDWAHLATGVVNVSLLMND